MILIRETIQNTSSMPFLIPLASCAIVISLLLEIRHNSTFYHLDLHHAYTHIKMFCYIAEEVLAPDFLENKNTH